MSGREKKCFVEALFLLATASVCVNFVAFKHIDSFLRSRIPKPAYSLPREQEVKLVQSSVRQATKALPWSALCLSQSIAEYVMLRRRGVQAAIVAGVGFADDRSLNAHAWVESGLPDHPKNGDTSGSYTVVMRIGPKVT
jgi:hypothetical protein